MVKSVTYQKAYVIGPYLQERIGIEIELDENQSPEDALDEAKKVSDEWHLKNNPHVGEPVTYAQPDLQENEIKPKFQPKQSPKEKQIANIASQIATVKDINVLTQTYPLIVKSYSELQPIYDNKLKELTV